MSMQVLHDAIRPDRAVRSLIEQFGAGVTLAAVVRQILAHRRSVRHAVPAEALPDWLRRDIGLPPRGAPGRNHAAARRPGIF